MAVPRRGDIIHLSLDPTLGKETRDGAQGGRFALVLSPEAFNKQSGLVLLAPISQGTGAGTREHGFGVTLMGAGTQTLGVVLCDQTRTVDARARRWKLIEAAPVVIVQEALAAVTSLLE